MKHDATSGKKHVFPWTPERNDAFFQMKKSSLMTHQSILLISLAHRNIIPDTRSWKLNFFLPF